MNDIAAQAEQDKGTLIIFHFSWAVRAAGG